LNHLLKIGAVAAACVVLALLAILFIHQGANSHPVALSPAGGVIPVAADLPPSVAQGNVARHAVAEVLSRRARGGLDPARVAASLEKTMLNQIADPLKVYAALPWLTERQRHDGRGFIEYDPYVLETKFVGDQVDIFLPELGITATGVVDRVERLDDDIMRWQGSFSNFSGVPNKFTLTQTLKDRYTVGTFETPMGSFNLESKNGYGWVVNQRSDFVLPKDGQDYIVDPVRRN
jgi:hypothetical protein